MTPGRPIEFDPDQVISAAMQTFWSKGYEATSMQDLLHATRLSKSSLYQAFGSKQQLFKRCMDTYVDAMVAQLRERLDASSTALGFIRDVLVEIASEGTRSHAPVGCLVMNTVSEFGQREPAIAEWVDGGIKRVRAVMEAAVRRAQKRGEINGRRSATALADFILSNIAGLRTLVKAGTPAKTTLSVVELVMASVAQG
jgi:TetR/AcrR family transcriptional repressor of nem operon